MPPPEADDVTIHRIGDYTVDYQLSALSDVAAKTKVMDDSLIAASATDITPLSSIMPGRWSAPWTTLLGACTVLDKIWDSQMIPTYLL